MTKLINPRDAALQLGVAVETLRKWRQEGKGPIFFKKGTGKKARVAYTQDTLNAFIGKGFSGTYEFTDPVIFNPPRY